MGLKLNEIEDIFNHQAIGNASRLWTLEVRKETEKTPAEGARERARQVGGDLRPDLLVSGHSQNQGFPN